jgi:hypothetical protein
MTKNDVPTFGRQAGELACQVVFFGKCFQTPGATTTREYDRCLRPLLVNGHQHKVLGIQLEDPGQRRDAVQINASLAALHQADEVRRF